MIEKQFLRLSKTKRTREYKTVATVSTIPPILRYDLHNDICECAVAISVVHLPYLFWNNNTFQGLFDILVKVVLYVCVLRVHHFANVAETDKGILDSMVNPKVI